jgi:hypothetical protein
MLHSTLSHILQLHQNCVSVISLGAVSQGGACVLWSDGQMSSCSLPGHILPVPAPKVQDKALHAWLESNMFNVQ